MKRFPWFQNQVRRKNSHALVSCARFSSSSSGAQAAPPQPKMPSTSVSSNSATYHLHQPQHHHQGSSSSQKSLADLIQNHVTRTNSIDEATTSPSFSWLDVAVVVPEAIATREVDTLLSCVNHKLATSANDKNNNNNSATTAKDDDNLSIETAVGLLTASQFAEIEIRSTEQYERQQLVRDQEEADERTNDASRSSSSAFSSPSSSALHRAVPLYLSNGIIPLSFRKHVSNGTATTRLLAEFLIHPNFCDSPTHQAILVDAAGKSLDRLASTVGAEAVEEFCLCVSSALEHVTMKSIQQETQNSTNTSTTNSPTSFQEIFHAEKQMIRESWRRFQRDVCKVNLLALTATVQAELANHLNLVRKCNNSSSSSNNNNTNFIANRCDHNHNHASFLSSAIVQADLAEGAKYKKMIRQHAAWLITFSSSSSLIIAGASSSSDSDNHHPVAMSSSTISQDEALATASSQLLEEISLFDFACAVDAMNLVSTNLLSRLPSDPSSSSSSSSGYIDRFRQSSSNKHYMLFLEELTCLSQGIINICPQGDDWISLRDSALMADAISRHFCEIVGVGSGSDGIFEEGKGKGQQQQQQQQRQDSSECNNRKINLLKELRGYHLLKILHKSFKLVSSSSSSLTASLSQQQKRDEEDQLRLDLQSVVKNYFPRGTQQQDSMTASTTIIGGGGNSANGVTLSSSYSSSSYSSSSFDGEQHGIPSATANTTVILGNTSSDYILLQHAHVAVVAVLCCPHSSSSWSDQQQQQEKDHGLDQAEQKQRQKQNVLVASAENCCSLLGAHKYYGVKVTSKMMLPMIKVLSPLGDSRVFNTIDVCTLFSGCSVTSEVLAEAFKTCAAAGDHHRARQLLQLLKADVPGLVGKLPQDGVDALVYLGVLPALSKSFFDDDDDDDDDEKGDVLPLNPQQK